MKPLKVILKHDGVRSLLCRLAAAYIRLVHATSRWEVRGSEIPDGFWDRGEPFILAFWHGRIVMTVKSWRSGAPMVMLASQHRDGQLITDIVSRFGIGFVAGSSSKGGAGALRVMLKALREGKSVGITPDGPRGPFMRAGGGVAAIARLSGAAIVPCTWAVRHRKVVGGWDRFVIPLPFTRGIVLWGQPIRIPADADDARIEQGRLEIEAALIAITAEADSALGLVPFQPGPALELAAS